MTEEKEIKLPITYDACPLCGSKKRLGQEYIQQLKDEGLLHKDSFSGGLVHQVMLYDPAHQPTVISQQFKIKVLTIYWDVCGCGMMYCTRFDCVETPVQIQTPPGPQRTQGLAQFPPPFFPRGNNPKFQ